MKTGDGRWVEFRSVSVQSIYFRKEFAHGLHLKWEKKRKIKEESMFLFFPESQDK